MSSQGNIDSTLKESRLFAPSEEFSSAAHIKSLEEYQQLYKEAEENPADRGKQPQVHGDFQEGCRRFQDQRATLWLRLDSSTHEPPPRFRHSQLVPLDRNARPRKQAATYRQSRPGKLPQSSQQRFRRLGEIQADLVSSLIKSPEASQHAVTFRAWRSWIGSFSALHL